MLVKAVVSLVSGILYRLDGWGRGDTFLPFFPFNRIPKWGGINYSRYAIGVVIALAKWNWIYVLTYGLAVSISYGEDGWLSKKLGVFQFAIVGLAFGLASLSLWRGIFCMVLFLGLKLFKVDHAIFEFVVGAVGVI